MYDNGIKSYRKTKVITADPGKLVLMCYEGIIDSLKIAKQKYIEKEYEEKYKAIAKSLDIIDELLCSLDFEKGGIIAGNLESLYNYMRGRIIQADVNKAFDGLDEVVGLLEELKSAWKIALEKQADHIQSSIELDNQNMQQVAGRMRA